MFSPSGQEHRKLQLYSEEVDLPQFLIKASSQSLFDAMLSRGYEMAMSSAAATATTLVDSDIETMVDSVIADTGSALVADERTSAIDFCKELLRALEKLQRAGQNRETLAALEEPLRRHPGDSRLRALQARTYATLGKRLLQHQAQAELYLIRGSVPAAIEQLQLAQVAGDGNFYELSAVEARLKELRARHAQELRDAKR